MRPSANGIRRPKALAPARLPNSCPRAAALLPQRTKNRRLAARLALPAGGGRSYVGGQTNLENHFLQGRRARKGDGVVLLPIKGRPGPPVPRGAGLRNR